MENEGVNAQKSYIAKSMVYCHVGIKRPEIKIPHSMRWKSLFENGDDM